LSAHAEWALVCRLFSTGTPVMKMRLSASEVDVLPALAKAVKPTSHNVSIVPCPYCGMNGGEVRRSRDGVWNAAAPSAAQFRWMPMTWQRSCSTRTGYTEGSGPR
jgi:hypothetical protein